MNRISGPKVNYFRNVVYQGKKDLITLNQSLEEIAENAADQAKKIQTAVLDKLSLKSVSDEVNKTSFLIPLPTKT